MGSVQALAQREQEVEQVQRRPRHEPCRTQPLSVPLNLQKRHLSAERQPFAALLADGHVLVVRRAGGVVTQPDVAVLQLEQGRRLPGAIVSRRAIVNLLHDLCKALGPCRRMLQERSTKQSGVRKDRSRGGARSASGLRALREAAASSRAPSPPLASYL